MSQYLVLSHIDIQNANSIAGLTWGFSAITHFLGFVHALNRKFSSHYEGEYESELTGCALISHIFQNKVYQPKKYADFEFLQSKNSPVLAKHKSESPPIIEEGKMNLTVSLVIELNKSLALTTEEIDKLQRKILSKCYQMHLAGGAILNIKKVKLLSASTQEQHIALLRKIKRLTMPGFVLLDRSDYLQEHYQALLARHKADESVSDQPQLLDAWLDFAALKYKAVPNLSGEQSEPDENTPADWEYVAKPNPGYLVPIMSGYKAIKPAYDHEEVKNVRMSSTNGRPDEPQPKVCFVEAIHSIGEWKSMYSLHNIDEIIWRYEHDGQWYLCKQNCSSKIKEDSNLQILKTEQDQTLNFNEALNLF